MHGVRLKRKELKVGRESAKGRVRYIEIKEREKSEIAGGKQLLSSRDYVFD